MSFLRIASLFKPVVVKLSPTPVITPVRYKWYPRRRVTIRNVRPPLIPAEIDDRSPVDPLVKCSDDAPLSEVKDPYAKQREICIVCKHGIKFDYKNPRLLSQFISSFSGRVYGKHVTGLCEYQQRSLQKSIALSRNAGYMQITQKDPRYLADPKLFNPMRPTRSNPF